MPCWLEADNVRSAQPVSDSQTRVNSSDLHIHSSSQCELERALILYVVNTSRRTPAPLLWCGNVDMRLAKSPVFCL
jgi:hypothetical protein